MIARSIAPSWGAWYDDMMLDPGSLITSYAKATQRLFLLDYDGVLAPIVSQPELAKPTPELRNLLVDLASNSQNTVVIVTGRAHQEIDEWLGALPVDISAEHGSFRKLAGAKAWKRLAPTPETWKIGLLPALESAVACLPKSFIEHKATALVLHYRNTDEQIVKSTLPQVRHSLQKCAENLPVVIQDGKKVLDIHLSCTNKGIAIKYWLDHTPPHDFVLIAGDDITDEDMFDAAPNHAITLHIGDQPTNAKHALATSENMVQVLESI